MLFISYYLSTYRVRSKIQKTTIWNYSECLGSIRMSSRIQIECKVDRLSYRTHNFDRNFDQYPACNHFHMGSKILDPLFDTIRIVNSWRVFYCSYTGDQKNHRMRSAMACRLDSLRKLFCLCQCYRLLILLFHTQPTSLLKNEFKSHDYYNIAMKKDV